MHGAIVKAVKPEREPAELEPVRRHSIGVMPRAAAERRARGSVVVLEILDPVTRRHVERAAEALQREFEGIVLAARRSPATSPSRADLLGGEAKVNVFVPSPRPAASPASVSGRWARQRALITKEQPEVLFVCVHNAGRSQMAAGLVKLRSEGRIHVRSAGSDPGEQINPAVVEAMEELGVDMSEEFPKPLTDEVVRAADVVITMGCGDACPIYPGKRYEDWELDDPAGQDLETVRRIRDEIDERVQRLVGELAPA